MKVVKRDGREVEFDVNKIKVAIRKANNEVDIIERVSEEKIDNIEEIEIEKEDLYIDSMFNIKEGEIYVIENKNIHISSMINCAGTLEIRNCTLYYNETENSPNRINLDENYSFKIENSKVICKNYNENFFINARYKD